MKYLIFLFAFFSSVIYAAATDECVDGYNMFNNTNTVCYNYNDITEHGAKIAQTQDKNIALKNIKFSFEGKDAIMKNLTTINVYFKPNALGIDNMRCEVTKTLKNDVSDPSKVALEYSQKCTIATNTKNAVNGAPKDGFLNLSGISLESLSTLRDTSNNMDAFLNINMAKNSSVSIEDQLAHFKDIQFKINAMRLNLSDRKNINKMCRFFLQFSKIDLQNTDQNAYSPICGSILLATASQIGTQQDQQDPRMQKAFLIAKNALQQLSAILLKNPNEINITANHVNDNHWMNLNALQQSDLNALVDGMQVQADSRN